MITNDFHSPWESFVIKNNIVNKTGGKKNVKALNNGLLLILL